ncbi:MAG TPA: copper transporter [Streptosporangiaceae bacterium]
MIDFRYHLVSIVAVFLALAIGIVVGATALKPSTVAVLDKTSQQERNQISSLLANNGNLQQQITNDQDFATAVTGPVLSHLLAGQRVVIVTAPHADGPMTSGITTALQQAGAQVTGQVAMQPEFFVAGQSTQSNLDYLAQQLAPPGISLGQGQPPGATAQIAGQAEAAQVISSALVAKDGPGVADPQSKAILDGFAQHGYLQVSGTNGTSMRLATLAVVVIPASPPAPADTDTANLALLALAHQLDRTGLAAVLAGSPAGSGPGSAIDELLSGSSGVQLSSVDNANYKTGQLMVAQALGLRLARHKPASYGVAPGAVPSPAPTPAATQSATPATTKKPKHAEHR